VLSEGGRKSGRVDSLQMFIDGGANRQADSCGPGEGGHNRRNASNQACDPLTCRSEAIPANLRYS
jgi:hypothetical protein